MKSKAKTKCEAVTPGEPGRVLIFIPRRIFNAIAAYC
jgi:hypothetical protein